MSTCSPHEAARPPRVSGTARICARSGSASSNRACGSTVFMSSVGGPGRQRRLDVGVLAERDDPLAPHVAVERVAVQPDAHARGDEREGEHRHEEHGGDLAEAVPAHPLVRQVVDLLLAARRARRSAARRRAVLRASPASRTGPPTGAVGSSGPIASMGGHPAVEVERAVEPYLHVWWVSREPLARRTAGAAAAPLLRGSAAPMGPGTGRCPRAGQHRRVPRQLHRRVPPCGVGAQQRVGCSTRAGCRPLAGSVVTRVVRPGCSRFGLSPRLGAG